MKKIKILFTIPNFLTAGSGREMFSIIERLDKNVFDPYIAVNEGGGALYDEIKDKGYNIIVQRFCAEEKVGLYNKLIKSKQLAVFYKQYGFEIWQSFNWSSDYTEAVVARLSGAKYVYVKKNMNWGRKAWKIKSVLANAIVARNTTMLQTMLSGMVYKNKTVYIPGAVDVNRFFKTASTYRDTVGIPEAAVLVSCVAQLVKVKDQLTLIKAVALIEGAYLILAGRFVDEEYVVQIKQLIKEHELQSRVILTGNVSDINSLLGATDIFVLPTSKATGHEEGCPVALLEAMAAKVPCVASDVAGNRDVVIHKKTGLLFTPGNVEELKNCLLTYIIDKTLAKKMADNAARMINDKHRLDDEAKLFGELYFKLTAQK